MSASHLSSEKAAHHDRRRQSFQLVLDQVLRRCKQLLIEDGPHDVHESIQPLGAFVFGRSGAIFGQVGRASVPVVLEISEWRMGEFLSTQFRIVPCEILRSCFEGLS